MRSIMLIVSRVAIVTAIWHFACLVPRDLFVGWVGGGGKSNYRTYLEYRTQICLFPIQLFYADKILYPTVKRFSVKKAQPFANTRLLS